MTDRVLFDIFREEADYRDWRHSKLVKLQLPNTAVFVEIANPFKLRPDEQQQMLEQIDQRNHTLYCYDSAQYKSFEPVQALCRQLGLKKSIASPEVSNQNIAVLYDRQGLSNQSGSRYIPYSSKGLKWHTDGYYNSAESMVRSFILHCDCAAEVGGENSLIDHELLYMHIRDLRPDWISALSRPDIMTIPENRQGRHVVREKFQGPVFALDPVSNSLYMRYTQRRRNIHWYNDPAVAGALNGLEEILNSDLPGKVTVKLSSGEGVLCNNIVHCRNSYADSGLRGEERRLYRIRFSERIGSARAIEKPTLSTI